MRIELALLEAPLIGGRWVTVLVFDAMATDGQKAALLEQLVGAAKQQIGVTAELNVLGYKEGDKPTYYGEEALVAYLQKHGVPRWTHHIEV
ncbi:hypothetical protein [Dyella terrae]|uniref:hypothetical protein n=1 Tax=Dyella terrae TaxID=522259 RepID=UPI001EFCEC17|nr:hypothetical protein [Dyella terrae]ULU24270.1 hypothetical protein DYST_01183 [Dyella terrae]